VNFVDLFDLVVFLYSVYLILIAFIMRYNLVLSSLVFASSVLSAYVPSEPWSTLTPKEPAPSGASTDYPQPFGIQIVTLNPTASGTAKRDVDQIADGQVQANSKKAATVVQQIGDGQVQHQTVSGVVQQIGDGQIQHQTTTLVTVVQQTSDGQVQHVTSTLTTVAAVSQAGDGQVQNTATPNDNVVLEACSTKNSLSMTIKGGELRDSKGRIGAIVANRQFQFDGPPPQAGSIYAGGWSVTADGFLALGDSTKFYQCKSGDFYNLYDQTIGAQCGPVKLAIVNLVSC
jgi:hypothetical protein